MGEWPFILRKGNDLKLLLSFFLFFSYSCTHQTDIEIVDTVILERAEFDFDCPEHKLRGRVLVRHYSNEMPIQIGVYGCRQKGVYIWAGKHYGWVLQSHKRFLRTRVQNLPIKH